MTRLPVFSYQPTFSPSLILGSVWCRLAFESAPCLGFVFENTLKVLFQNTNKLLSGNPICFKHG
ncbi:MAG: hypothetical protein ACPIOQ_25665, partial [Promethearchaeia archaeon]